MYCDLLFVSYYFNKHPSLLKQRDLKVLFWRRLLKPKRLTSTFIVNSSNLDNCFSTFFISASICVIFNIHQSEFATMQTYKDLKLLSLLWTLHWFVFDYPFLSFNYSMMYQSSRLLSRATKRLSFHQGVGKSVTPFSGLLHLPLICTLKCCVSSNGGIKYEFWVFGMTQLGLSPGLPDLWWTLYPQGQWPSLWYTPMDPHIWPSKSRMTSSNIHTAALWRYRIWPWRPPRGDER